MKSIIAYKFILVRNIFNNAMQVSSGVITKMWLNRQNFIMLILNTIMISCFLSSLFHKGSHNPSSPKFGMCLYVTLWLNSTLKIPKE